MSNLSLRIDVSSAIPFPGKSELAITVHWSKRDDSNELPLVIFALPGGGYSRSYFDMHFDGHVGYSEAEWHSQRGVVFVACDHLGVGESTATHLHDYTMAHLAAAYALAVDTISDRIRHGTLSPEMPALSTFTRVGIGQSMGGCMTIVSQANHGLFDGIGVFGFSAIHTQLPQPSGAAHTAAQAALSAGGVGDFRIFDRDSALAQVADFVYPFHFEDVPRDIVDADMAGGYPLRRTSPPFGSMTLPACAAPMMSAGVVADDAAAINVPVLIGVGERDTCPDPHAEPGAYRSSRDISLFIAPNMAHMHNFASTRQQFWQNTLSWSMRVAQLKQFDSR